MIDKIINMIKKRQQDLERENIFDGMWCCHEAMAVHSELDELLEEIEELKNDKSKI